jgi:hypothetical protein
MTEILLKRELEPLARQQQRYKLLLALAVCWGVVALFALVVFVGARYVLPLAPGALIAIVGAFAVIGAFISARIVNRTAPDYRNIARQIETKRPDMHTLLVTAVEQRRDDSGRLGYLQERLLDEALGAIRQEQKLAVVPRRKMASAGLIHIVALAALIAVLFQVPRTPTMQGSVFTTLTKAESKVTVTPGDANVERGSALVVLARFDGAIPPEATLVVTTNGGTAQRIPLAKNLNDPVFGASISEVRGPLSYRIEYGDGDHTADFQVKVFEHPRLERADAQITYPSYTELPTKRVEDTKRISAVEGSVVDFDFQLNKPVATARLVAKDQTVIPLTIETNKAQAHLKAFTLETSKSYELQLVDADGRSNKLATTLVFEALTNGRPTLKFIAPRGDQRVSPLQEMLFSGEAQDDFGLKQFGLSYSVGGADLTALALGSNAPAKMKTNFTHLLKLEELHAEPDQLVSYYIWADDIGPDGKLRRTSSDMFFAEVRAFEEIFREAESMNSQQQQEQQQQQRQNQATKMAEAQKQIINATWNLQRRETSPKLSAKYLEDEPVVRDSQEGVLEEASALEEQAQDARSKEALQTAIKHMEKALEQLNEGTNSLAPLPKALVAEQAAYQALLKLQAREFQVARAQKQQGQQQQQQNQRNQSQIEQLDLKQQENNYETERQATAQQEQDPAKMEQMEQLNRLKELAQRQQDINEKLKELQTALQEAKTEKEKEDIQRELKRLREEQREMLADMDEMKQRMEKQQGEQAQSREAQQQMEQARQEAQKSSEALEKGNVPQALASGTRAERELQKMRDEARKKNSSQFADDMKQMRNQARDMAEKQTDIQKKIEEQASQPKALSDAGESEKLANQLAEQKQALTNLLNQMKRVSEQSENAEPLLSKQLYDSLRKNSQGNLDQSLAATEELVKRNFPKEAQQFEQRANTGIQNLKKDVERAAESVLGDETEALRAAKRELDALTDRLAREMARAMATNNAGSNAMAAGANGRGTNGNSGARSTNALAGANRTGITNGVGTNFVAGGRGGNTNSANTNFVAGGRSGTNSAAGGGQNTNGTQLASNQQAPGNGQTNQRNANGQQPGQANSQDPQGQQGNQPGQQVAQNGQGQQPGQQNQPGQQGQQGQNPQGQQPGQTGQQGQQPGRGQQAQNQQGQQPGQEQGQQAPNQQPGQQGQGQQAQNQQGQPGQQGQQGQGQQGQAQQLGQQQANAQNPGEPQQGQPNQNQQQPNQNPGRNRNGQRANQLANLFNQPGAGTRTQDRESGEPSPLLGEDDFSDWSQRLSNVEEMLDRPELRNQVAQARDRARATRTDFKRNNKPPKWDMVQKDILKPLVEVREKVADELSRRDSNESLAPIDRDPVPNKYTDLVKRYYETLGQGK